MSDDISQTNKNIHDLIWMWKLKILKDNYISFNIMLYTLNIHNEIWEIHEKQSASHNNSILKE
jgi:hypothetical protein